MSAEATTHAGHASSLPISHEKVGMISFLVTEAAFFTTLIMSYLYYIGKSKTGPQPADVFEDISVTIISTVLLLSSSITVHLADGAFKKGKHSVFVRFWFLTIALGVAFLVGTAIEWHGLIFEHDLTIATNFFGTTYFTLVGFHAFHVTLGVLMMSTVFCLALLRRVQPGKTESVELVSWYWHFVDVVWVVVFSVVYIFGRS